MPVQPVSPDGLNRFETVQSVVVESVVIVSVRQGVEGLAVRQALKKIGEGDFEKPDVP